MRAGVARALADLARAFEHLRLRWYVFGAQAVVAAGVPRTTADIDVTVEVGKAGTEALLESLTEHGFAYREGAARLRAFIAETRVVPAMHVASKLPVDVVLAGPGLEEDMLGRVILRRVGRRAIPFIDTADLVSLKMLAGRDKDVEDVRALVRIRPSDLDLRVARERISALGALLENPEILEMFDNLVGGSKTRSKPKASKTPRNPAASRGRRR